MLKKEKKKNESLTNKDLEKALESQSKTILKAVDFGFKNVRGEMNLMKGDINLMKGDINLMKGDIKTVKGDIKSLKQTTGKILNQQDRFVKRLDDLEQENDMSTDIYKEHDKKIEKHEKRIFALEAKS